MSMKVNMDKLRRIFTYWLWDNHRDIVPLIILGQHEVITDEIAKEFSEWCKTDEFKQLYHHLEND